MLAALAALLAAPLAASAAVVVRGGNEVTIGAQERVDANFYALGRMISTSGEVAGDFYAAAGSVVVNAAVRDDLSVLGGTVSVHAPVGGDVRVFGGQVVIAESVGGDLAVFGGELTILSTAEIGGDILFYGGSLDVQGSTRGSVTGTGERIRINGAVGGDVALKTHGTLTLGSRAAIAGTVQYESPFELSRALEATVAGEITRTELAASSEPRVSIVPFLALAFAALALRFVLGRRVDEQVRYTLRSFGSYGLIGFGVFLLAPLAAALLVISTIGSLIGLLLFILYALLLFAALALAPIAVGAQVAMLLKRGNPFGVWWILGGTAIFFIVSLVPFIGFMFAAAVTLIMFGGLLSRLYRSIR